MRWGRLFGRTVGASWEWSWRGPACWSSRNRLLGAGLRRAAWRRSRSVSRRGPRPARHRRRTARGLPVAWARERLMLGPARFPPERWRPRAARRARGPMTALGEPRRLRISGQRGPKQMERTRWTSRAQWAKRMALIQRTRRLCRAMWVESAPLMYRIGHGRRTGKPQGRRTGKPQEQRTWRPSGSQTWWAQASAWRPQRRRTWRPRRRRGALAQTAMVRST
jgi:hypothetical protein